MHRSQPAVFAFTFLFVGGTCIASMAADQPKVSGADDPDFKFQGEYTGMVTPPDGNGELKVGTQVIALGDGKFHAVGYLGGLPGDGWDGASKIETDGQRDGDVVKFEADQAKGEIKDGAIRILGPNDEVLAELKKVERKSPTLGAKPPAGAIVLFDGASQNDFGPGKVSPEGLLMAGVTSKRKIQNAHLHVEFLLPFMPAAREQGRANSGCYLQGRYEVQMLDSFGLKGEDNECGAIYGIRAPDVNMCFPPLAWQTFDIDYTAAKYDGDKKVKNASIKVSHNGVVIHDQAELPTGTRAAPIKEGPDAGPIFLQDHGNPVLYRNVWLVEKP